MEIIAVPVLSAPLQNQTHYVTYMDPKVQLVLFMLNGKKLKK